jgi:hypothetical protein
MAGPANMISLNITIIDVRRPYILGITREWRAQQVMECETVLRLLAVIIDQHFIRNARVDRRTE